MTEHDGRPFFDPPLSTAGVPIPPRHPPVTTDDPTASVFERHAGDWHEWSIGDLAPPAAAPHQPPHRLFVRLQDQGLVDVVLARATSYAPGARELEGTQLVRLLLTSSEVRWLLAVLPRALALKEAGQAPAPPEDEDVAW